MVTIREKNDECVEAVALALAKYEEQHPNADVVVYRQNSVSVRARVIDPDFRGTSKADRHDVVWSFLTDLPEDQQSQISVLLLLAPDEAPSSSSSSTTSTGRGPPWRRWTTTR